MGAKPWCTPQLQTPDAVQSEMEQQLQVCGEFNVVVGQSEDVLSPHCAAKPAPAPESTCGGSRDHG